jgi:cell wall-associated NlpC family hydrolase
LRAQTPGCRKALRAAIAAGALAVAVLIAPASAQATFGSGGTGVVLPKEDVGGGAPALLLPPTPAPGAVARMARDGRTAIPPAAAPPAVKQAIYAANEITRKPYRYGGGHRRVKDSGYDCSGAVSYALRGAGVLPSPLHSSAFMRWGKPGPGQWITVYTHSGHAYVVIAGLRFDTSGPGGGRGPRWRTGARSSRGYVLRHPDGL